MSSLNQRLAAAGTAAVLATSTLLLAAPSEAAAPTCRASMSDASPAQYSNVWVNVWTVANANVRTVAHYKTTDTVHGGKTGPAGKAGIKYYISGASVGYGVMVDVTVTGPAGASGHCTTSFVPHA